MVFLRNYGAVRFGTVRFGSIRFGDASGINSVEILYLQKISPKDLFVIFERSLEDFRLILDLILSL